MTRVRVIAAAAALSMLAVVTPAFTVGAGAASDRAPTFIVTLRSGEPREVAADHARRYGADIEFVYEHALRGYAARVSEDQIGVLARDSRVARVERDQVVHAVGTTQEEATWGIDRIDARVGTDGTYNYSATGAGVTAYVIDTGIRATHQDFGSRVGSSGFTAFDDGRGWDDCHGHGTHVAGTVGGATWGVAKAVSLVAVRVLDCNGSGSWSGVIAGIDWVTADAGKLLGPAVANMSLGGGASDSVDQAVRHSIAAGISYAIAAGNGNRAGIAQDACKSSPARVEEAMTVGATDKTDTKTSWSNYGACVDWFAPGASITSAWYSSDTATKTISGTSMAAPHAAGVAALYLEAIPGSTAQQVRDALHGASTKGIVTSSNTDNNHLLYSLVAPAGLAIIGLTATPDSFNAETTSTKVSFALSEPASWTASVVSGSGTVCAVSSDGVVSGDQSFVWEGTNCSNGVLVVDGSYSVDVVAETTTETANASTNVLVDRTAPGISAVEAIDVTASSATIGWTTDEPADSVVQYSLSQDFSSIDTVTVEVPDLVTTHSVALSGLAETETYYYRVTSTDAVGNATTAASTAQWFTTAVASTSGPQVTGIDHGTEGGRAGTQHLTVTVTVGDGSGGVGANVSVVGTITVDTGDSMAISGTTGTDGTLTVKWTNAPSGCYTTTITAPSEASATFVKPGPGTC